MTITLNKDNNKIRTSNVPTDIINCQHNFKKTILKNKNKTT